MFLDILLLLFLLLATYKGYTRGLIVGVFSLVAIIVGLAAAMKLSVVATDYFRAYFSWEGKWVPPLSFLLVLVGVIPVSYTHLRAPRDGLLSRMPSSA